jgi:hypothetical protein
VYPGLAAGDEAQVRLSAGEIRRLLAGLTPTAHPPGHHLRWSRWRRHHQARARLAHYQRRLKCLGLLYY